MTTEQKHFHTLITCTQLADALATSNLRILDCRFDLSDTQAGRQAYTRSHIPGAAYAHLDEDMSGPILPGTAQAATPCPTRTASPAPSPASASATAPTSPSTTPAAAAWPPACGGCCAGSATNPSPSSMAAGTPGPPPPSPPAAATSPCSPAASRPHPAPSSSSTPPKCSAKTASGGALVIDARAADRFRGENETHDPIGGHIPGASNLPQSGNLRHGLFLQPEELAARFSELMGNRPPSEVIFYCGSGVSACHNILALEHAGLGEARLYPGSWSDWITDPTRPTAQG